MHAQGDHATCDPDVCFTAKMRYWRMNGTPQVRYEGGRMQFHDHTIRELQDQQVKEGRAAGYDPVPVERGTWT